MFNLTLFLIVLRGEVFNAFFRQGDSKLLQLRSENYVEFTIGCFDVIDSTYTLELTYIWISMGQEL